MENLEGSCSCGRNRYIVIIPANATNEAAQVIFDNGHNHRRSQATPLSAWLRVPLEWHRSSTHAFHDDETHTTIRRSYTSPSEQHAKRHFCGFCGTPLSYWTESPPEEAAYISLTLGTLSSDKLRNLEDLGLLPREATAEYSLSEEEPDSEVRYARRERGEVVGNQGLPWFDTLVEGSRLGNMKRSMGVQRSRDGNVRVEWEIVEFTSGGGEEQGAQTPNLAKRKLDDVLNDGDNTGTDSKMEGLH